MYLSIMISGADRDFMKIIHFEIRLQGMFLNKTIGKLVLMLFNLFDLTITDRFQL